MQRPNWIEDDVYDGVIRVILSDLFKFHLTDFVQQKRKTSKNNFVEFLIDKFHCSHSM